MPRLEFPWTEKEIGKIVWPTLKRRRRSSSNSTPKARSSTHTSKAAEEAGAFNPDQILILLTGRSRLVKCGRKQVVRVVAVGDDGKEAHHTPAQAIWHMKQDKGNFNLFRGLMSQTSTLAPPAKIDAKPDLEKLMANMTPEEYRRLRREQPEIFGLNPLPNNGR